MQWNPRFIRGVNKFMPFISTLVSFRVNFRSTDLHNILKSICQFRAIRRREGGHFRTNANSIHFRPSHSMTLRCRCERLEYRKITFQHALLERIMSWKYRQSTAANSISLAVLFLRPQQTLPILSCAGFHLCQGTKTKTSKVATKSETAL